MPPRPEQLHLAPVRELGADRGKQFSRKRPVLNHCRFIVVPSCSSVGTMLFPSAAAVTKGGNHHTLGGFEGWQGSILE